MNLRLTYTQPQLDIFFPAVKERHNVFPKGRRFGATRGGAHAFIEWSLEGMTCLWGDTVHGNIERYWERYFLPPLKSHNIDARFDRQKKVAYIGPGYIDFRSADKPENWEGFGYRKIMLNEAGIILKDPYLYTNAVRPMMIDPGSDSELFALGVPKGKTLKDGSEHPFYTLWQKVGTPGYRGARYSSYDNPLLDTADIAELEKDIGAMDPRQIQQEIYGEFIDRASGNPFIHKLDPEKHVRETEPKPLLPFYVSVDFNVEPFCAIICQIWQDAQGVHFHTHEEVVIRSGTIQEMAERIATSLRTPHMVQLTGDRTGDNRRIGLRDNMSMFEELRKALLLNSRQVSLPNNPGHLVSREQCNYILAHHPDVRISPGCTGLVNDLNIVEIDDNGHIVKQDRSKGSQRADLLDCWRYAVNTYLSDWIERDRNAMRYRRPLSAS